MKLSSIGNAELVRELVHRFHGGIFVGRDNRTDEPTVYWNPKGDLYAAFYLFKFLRQAVVAQHRQGNALAGQHSPAASSSHSSLEPEGSDVLDLELIETDVLFSHIFFRFPTFATILVRPNLGGDLALRTAYWQGPNFEVLGLLTFAEELFEEATLKLPARNQIQDVSVDSKTQASQGLRYSMNEDGLKMHAAGPAVQVFGFAQYVAAQAFQACAHLKTGDTLTPGGFDFDG